MLKYATKAIAEAVPVIAKLSRLKSLSVTIWSWLIDWLVPKSQEKTWKINGWNLRIRAPWKRKIMFQIIILRFYVNLRGCTCHASGILAKYYAQVIGHPNHHLRIWRLMPRDCFCKSWVSHVLSTGYRKIMLLWTWCVSKIDTHKNNTSFTHIDQIRIHLQVPFRFKLKEMQASAIFGP